MKRDAALLMNDYFFFFFLQIVSLLLIYEQIGMEHKMIPDRWEKRILYCVNINYIIILLLSTSPAFCSSLLEWLKVI